MGTKREILTEARALIEDENHWTQGCYAVNEKGVSCLPCSPDAVRWCSIGAISRALHGVGFSTLVFPEKGAMTGIRLNAFLDQCADQLSDHKWLHATSLNDNETHRDVMELFNLAIQRAETEEHDNA